MHVNAADPGKFSHRLLESTEEQAKTAKDAGSEGHHSMPHNQWLLISAGSESDFAFAFWYFVGP